MSFLNNILASLGLAEKTSSADAARDRLMVVVSHQRRHRGSPDYLPRLEKDILAVIAKYVKVEEDKVKVRFDRGDNLSTLEVNVDLPTEEALKPRVRSINSPSADLISAAKGSPYGAARRDTTAFRHRREPEYFDR